MIRPGVGVDQAQVLDQEIDREDAGDARDQLGEDQNSQEQVAPRNL